MKNMTTYLTVRLLAVHGTFVSFFRQDVKNLLLWHRIKNSNEIAIFN